MIKSQKHKKLSASIFLAYSSRYCLPSQIIYEIWKMVSDQRTRLLSAMISISATAGLIYSLGDAPDTQIACLPIYMEQTGRQQASLWDYWMKNGIKTKQKRNHSDPLKTLSLQTVYPVGCLTTHDTNSSSLYLEKTKEEKKDRFSCAMTFWFCNHWEWK